MFIDESDLTEEEKKQILEKLPKKPKQDAPQEQKDEFDRQISELKIISEKIKEANKILTKYGKKSVEERSLEEFYKIIFEIADLNTDENGEPKYEFFGLEKQIAGTKFKISTKQIK